MPRDWYLERLVFYCRTTSASTAPKDVLPSRICASYLRAERQRAVEHGQGGVDSHAHHAEVGVAGRPVVEQAPAACEAQDYESRLITMSRGSQPSYLGSHLVAPAKGQPQCSPPASRRRRLCWNTSATTPA